MKVIHEDSICVENWNLTQNPRKIFENRSKIWKVGEKLALESKFHDKSISEARERTNKRKIVYVPFSACFFPFFWSKNLQKVDTRNIHFTKGFCWFFIKTLIGPFSELREPIFFIFGLLERKKFTLSIARVFKHFPGSWILAVTTLDIPSKKRIRCFF